MCQTLNASLSWVESSKINRNIHQSRIICNTILNTPLFQMFHHNLVRFIDTKMNPECLAVGNKQIWFYGRCLSRTGHPPTQTVNFCSIILRLFSSYNLSWIKSVHSLSHKCSGSSLNLIFGCRFILDFLEIFGRIFRLKFSVRFHFSPDLVFLQLLISAWLLPQDPQ